MWWWNLLPPALVGGMYLAKRLFENRRLLRVWHEALRGCPVTDQKSSGLWTWRAKLTARSGPLELRITDAGGDNEQSKVVIKGPEGLSALKLRRRILKHEIKVGDEKFDDAFFVDGPLRTVYARLDATMRQMLLRAYADCNPLNIGDGRLSVEVSEEKLSRLLPLLLDIGRQLAQPISRERQIAENALQDPEDGVRLVNLLLLVREHPGDPETLRVLRAACSDASPQVRLRAAIELGDEGRKILQNLAEDSQDDASSAQAVTHLAGRLPFERLSSILSDALSKGLLQTARAAAVALGTTGEAAAEPPLLQEAAERSLFDLALRRTARQAISEIQARLQGASPGQLSLTQVEAGQLSLAPFEAGQLSLAPTEAEPAPDRPVRSPEQLSGPR